MSKIPLPPPNWSPTGESGYWVWREKASYDQRKKQWVSKWKWYSDEEYQKLNREQV